jgi:hypothetical protein
LRRTEQRRNKSFPEENMPVTGYYIPPYSVFAVVFHKVYRVDNRDFYVHFILGNHLLVNLRKDFPLSRTHILGREFIECDAHHIFAADIASADIGHTLCHFLNFQFHRFFH